MTHNKWIKTDEKVSLIRKNSGMITVMKGSNTERVLTLIKQGHTADQIYAKVKDNISARDFSSYIVRMAKKVGDTTGTQKQNKTPKKVSKVSKHRTPTTPKTPVKSNIVVSDDMKEYIPKTNGYIAGSLYGTTDVKLLTKLYQTRKETLLIGATGCGKTHLARTIAYEQKAPYKRLNLNGCTTPEDLVGQWIPNSEKEGAKYRWVDGWLTRFMRKGGILVIDEINMANPEILSILHSVTDKGKELILTQKDGEHIVAHKDFWLVATMNPSSDYEGTRELNLALKDRFRIIYMDYNQTTEKKLKIDEKVLKVADALRKSEEIKTPISTRDLLFYQEDKADFGESVARNFFLNKFEDIEKEVVKEVIEMHIDGKAPKNEVEDKKDEDGDDDTY